MSSFYQLIQSDSIGYVQYSSFLNNVTSENMDQLIVSLASTSGIIIDVRGNEGGEIENIFTMIEHFADSTRLVYQSFLKNGNQHNDFAPPDNIYIGPSNIHYTKTVCVLIDKNSFSSTSYFALAMHAFPHVFLVGDTTGGGLGGPSGVELPNGWGLRFPVTYTLSPDGINFENGEPPDVTSILSENSKRLDFDNVISTAIEIINTKKAK